MIGTRPICLDCKHKIFEKGRSACKAFPGGIPDEIFYAGFIHTKPYPGDNGIQFEPIEKTKKEPK